MILVKKKAWNRIFRKPFCLIPLPFSCPESLSLLNTQECRACGLYREKAGGQETGNSAVENLLFLCHSYQCLHRSKLSGWMLQLQSYSWSGPLQPWDQTLRALRHWHLQTASSFVLYCWTSANTALEELIINLVSYGMFACPFHFFQIVLRVSLHSSPCYFQTGNTKMVPKQVDKFGYNFEMCPCLKISISFLIKKSSL